MPQPPSAIDPDKLHSITLGSFRLPGDYFSNMLRLYPDEPLFASLAVAADGMTAGRKGMATYRYDLESELMDYCNTLLQDYVTQEKIHRHAAI